MAVLVLIDHAAHRVRIEAGEGAVHHHLRHRDLAAHGFAAGLEIDRFGEAFLRFGARLLVEQAEPLGRRLGALVVGIDFALGGDALAALGGLDRLVRRRRQRRHHLHVGIGQPARHHDHRLFAGLPALDAFGSAAERELPKNRLAVLTEKPSRDGAGSSAIGDASWRGFQIVERLGFERQRDIVLRQRRRAQRVLQVRDRAARAPLRRQRRSFGALHRSIRCRRDLRSRARR